MVFFSIILFLFLFPLAGGFFGLYFKDKLHLILGFSAGSVAGLAFFELIPESFHMLEEISFGGEFLHPALVLGGIIIYMLLDRVLKIHKHNHEENGEHSHDHLENGERKHSGKFKATTFSFHGFIDGVVVGLAIQTSITLGVITAIAVIAHSFSDGLNTSIVCQRSGMKIQDIKKWILTNASSPVFGLLLGFSFKLPEVFLGIILSIVSGFFVYISMTELVPESFHKHPTKWTTFSTILGMIFIALVVIFTHASLA